MDRFLFNGEKLSELRKAKGIKQDVMAKDLSISTPTLSRYETGERQPTVQALCMISEYLDVSIDYFIQSLPNSSNPDELTVRSKSLPGVIAKKFRSHDTAALNEKRISKIIDYIDDQITLSKLKDGNRN